MSLMKWMKEIFIVVYSSFLFELAFYGATHFKSSLYAFLIPIAIIMYRIKKYEDKEYLKPARKFFWMFVFIMMIIAFIRVPVENNEANLNSNATTARLEKRNSDKDTLLEKTNWKERLEIISKKKLTKTEKFNETMMLTKNVYLTSEELSKYTSYLLQEHHNDSYIDKISDEEYALKNIFISYLVSENANLRSVDAFAFDFHQNSKYIYREVDTATSHDTIENARQLNKNRHAVEEAVSYNENERIEL